MRISYNWLRQYVHTHRDVHQVAEILTAAGLEVESVEKVEAVRGGLKGVVVGEVLTCTKHPDADRLSVTSVNVGAEAPLQIVCGAPNVAAGQKVLVATVGATLYPGQGEPLAIKKSKIRGVESHGMICAQDELGLGHDHSGILVLPQDAPPGMPAGSFLELADDYCLEIGLTPNRTDAISHTGVALDLALALRYMEGIGNEAASCEIPSPAALPETANSPIKIEVLDPVACGRYSGAVVEKVQVGPSPKWLQDRLKAIGQRPVNNIVDITNFVQHETGQPLHAFDADKIKGGKIVVRLASEGEPLTTLDGQARKLSDADLVIADAEAPMCIAGVFGGAHSGVQEGTTRIFLESAWFHPAYIRKTARQHALHTDAGFRFERGCDPEKVPLALFRAVELMRDMGIGVAASGWSDFYPAPFERKEVRLRWKKLQQLTGKVFDSAVVRALLADMHMELRGETEEGLLLGVPLYRVDVTREADVIEEILRIIGYNSVEIPTRMSATPSQATQPDAGQLRFRTAALLAAGGFSEMMAMSLTRASWTERLQPLLDQPLQPVTVRNPLSSDLGIMRPTLLTGMLEAVAFNQNYKATDLRLFEFGNTYLQRGPRFQESPTLGLLVCGRRATESWNNNNGSVDLNDLRAACDSVLTWLGLSQGRWVSTQHPYLDQALTFSAPRHQWVVAGRVKPVLAVASGVQQPVWYAEFDWDDLVSAAGSQPLTWKPIPKYPAVRRDLSLLLDASVPYGEIERIAFETERKLLRAVNLFDVYEGKNLEPGKKSYAISFTLQDANRTMTDAQVESAMSAILRQLQEKLGAKLRA